jgi:hypothetical protein
VSAKPPIKFESKDAIKDFIDGAWKAHGLEGRDQLARALGISSSALYGYITRLEIPEKTHQKFSRLGDEIRRNANPASEKSDTRKTNGGLAEFSLDDLLEEIEKRGWRVDLSRILKDK